MTIQPNGLIQDAEWNRLIQYTGSQFDEVTLSRGFLYYKQGRVIKLELPEPAAVTALVKGSAEEPYEVSIPLDTLSLASCTCPVDEPCKHIAAALMKLAEVQGRSVNSLANAKAKQLLASSRSAASTAAAANSSPAAAESPASISGTSSSVTGTSANGAAGTETLPASVPAYAHSSRAALSADAGIESWHRQFERVTAELDHAVRNTAYADKALELILQAPRDLSPAAERLYGLHAHLYVQQSLLQPVKVPGITPAYSSHLGYFTHIAVGEIDKAVLLSLEDAPAASEIRGGEQEALSRLLQQSLAWIRREMLRETRERYYFSHYYRLFLQEWMQPAFPEAGMLRGELEQLLAAEQASPSSPSSPTAAEPAEEGHAGRQRATLTPGPGIQPYALQTAQGWILALLGEDEQAWVHLRSAASLPSGLRPEDLAALLDTMQRSGNWPRLTHWLNRLAPLLRNSRANQLEPYFRYWETASAHDPAAEPLMWQTLEEMLPAAQRFYERKLFEHGRWREWMDYQLAAGAEPLDFKVKDLQAAEKADPALLLPFYHQAVERYVTHKNRDSYKKAAKLLKRLAKLYVKLKRTERWELFISTFAARHSRLRALQEELRKGNLI